MTWRNLLAGALALTLVFAPADARRKPKVEPKIKVSCVGNSITYGMRLDDRERESYPVRLQEMPMRGARWQACSAERIRIKRMIRFIITKVAQFNELCYS